MVEIGSCEKQKVHPKGPLTQVPCVIWPDKERKFEHTWACIWLVGTINQYTEAYTQSKN